MPHPPTPKHTHYTHYTHALQDYYFPPEEAAGPPEAAALAEAGVGELREAIKKWGNAAQVRLGLDIVISYLRGRGKGRHCACTCAVRCGAV